MTTVHLHYTAMSRIAGRILDFTVVKAGSEIGYFSGKPVKLRDR